MWRCVLLLPALALCASPAAASTLSYGRGAYTYTGSGADNVVTIEGFVFTDSEVITVTAGADPRCSDSATTVTCQAAGITTLVAGTGAGADRLTVLDSDLPLEADGGPGNDTITASRGDDTIAGGVGDDTIAGGDGLEVVLGEAGDDTLTGASGDDFLFGGDGDDVITGGEGGDALDGNDDDDTVIAGPENDDINGGAGTGDRIRYDETDRPTGVVVDLSTLAGTDGGPGETGEDAIAFEHVTASRFADELKGDAQVNAIDAGDGDDRVDVADGLAEDVDCGDGTDAAEADPVDRLTACESGPVPTPTPSPSPSPGPSPSPSPGPSPSPSPSPSPTPTPASIPAPAPSPPEPAAGSPQLALLDTAIVITVNRNRVITRLRVRRLPAGARLVISCDPPRDRRCPLTRAIRRTFREARPRIDFAASFKRRRLPVGTVIEVRVTAADAIGRVRKVIIRRSGTPSVSRCVRPGATRTIRCPMSSRATPGRY